MKVFIEGQEIGEATDIKYKIGVDLAKQDTDSMVVALHKFSNASRRAGLSMARASYNIRMNTRRFNKFLKGILPNSLWAKGYKIVNHRGRNKLVKL